MAKSVIVVDKVLTPEEAEFRRKRLIALAERVEQEIAEKAQQASKK